MRYLISQKVLYLSVVFFLICLFIAVPYFLRNVVPLAVLDVASTFGIFLPVITSILLVIRMSKYAKQLSPIEDNNTRWNNFPISSFFFFFVSIGIEIMFSTVAISAARDEVKHFLNKVSDKVEIRINGELYENPKELITVLKQVAPLPAHHTHTINKIHIKIVDHNETLELVSERDSDYPAEYWIFYPKYRCTSRSEVGRIVTSIFDDY